MMRKVLIALGVVAGLIAAVVVAAPLLVSTDDLLAAAKAQVRQATGRELIVDGGVGFSLFPRVEVSIADAALSDAGWTGRAEMARFEALEIGVALAPALSGELQIDRIVLRRPEITLEKAADGRTNWTFTPPAAEQAGRDAPVTEGAEAGAGPAGAPADGSAEAGRDPLSRISIGAVSLIGGSARYIDRAAGTEERFDDIALDFGLPGIDQPFSADGGLRWRGEAISIDLETGALGGLIDGAPTALDLAVEGDPLSLALDGAVTLADAPRLDGAVSLDIPSLRSLAAWAADPLPDDLAPGALERMTISGDLDGAADRISFENAELRLDDIRAEGAVAIMLGGARPRIDARLDTGPLNLNPYIGAVGDAPAAGGAPAGGDAPAATAPARAPAAAAGWSTDPIDVSAFALMDGALALSVAGLTVGDLTLDGSELDARLDGGVMTLFLRQLSLYDGTAKGELRLDARQPAFTLDFDMAVDGVQAYPLLVAVAEFDRLEGRAYGSLRAQGRGASQDAIVRSLTGSGDLRFLDGAILGVDIAGTARQLLSAGLTEQPAERPKTDFAELTGTLGITNGVARNNDLSLLAPLLRVTGEGEIDLPNKSLDYCVNPRLVASLQGQGSDGGEVGIKPITVKLDGPWDTISPTPRFFSCDPERAARMAAEAAARALTGDGLGAITGEGGLGDAVRDVLPGLLGGGSAPAADGAGAGEGEGAGEDATPAANPVETLRGLFGR